MWFSREGRKNLGGAYTWCREGSRRDTLLVFNAISRKMSITDRSQLLIIYAHAKTTREQFAFSPRVRGTERESARTILFFFFHREEEIIGVYSLSVPRPSRGRGIARKRERDTYIYIIYARRRNGARELLRNVRWSCVVVASV